MVEAEPTVRTKSTVSTAPPEKVRVIFIGATWPWKQSAATLRPNRLVVFSPSAEMFTFPNVPNSSVTETHWLSEIRVPITLEASASP